MVSLGPSPSILLAGRCICGHTAAHHLDDICMVEDCLCMTYAEAPEAPSTRSNRAFMELLAKGDEIAKGRIDGGS